MNKRTNPDPETLWMCHDLFAGWLPWAWGESKKLAMEKIDPLNWPSATAHRVKISKVKTKRKKAKQR